MPPSRSWILASTLLLAGASADTERISVIDYDFAAGREAPARDPRLFGPQLTAHGFSHGFQRPGDEGVWMLGTEAQFDFLAEGRACEILLEFATNDVVAGQGQELAIRLNGQPLATYVVRRWGQARLETVAVPDEILRQGWNRLQLTAATCQDVTVAGQRQLELPYAVYFYRLAVRLSATSEQRERMQETYTGDPDTPPWSWAFTDSQPATSTTHPDVLIVLLDAARRDHFGCYGYGRETTPFIDSLAAEGLRFEQVFTDVPFTRGAVSSLLTGHSWVHHRVTDGDGTLGDDLPTLAQRLSAAGYHTLGVSHNPNASVVAGSARGFDEFVEVWKLPGPRKRGMEAPARFLLERLDEGLPDQPSFCYLHVVPPHAPYRPRAEDDLWSNPDYAGILENAGHDLTLLDQGRLPWDEADRQQALDLYDGNLRRGDALVQSVVEAWRRRRPHRELLTVIVSDHGEAFAEHGRFLHSTTLYDEMTAIPLILHPASLCSSLAGSASQLRSITDVMPMLLRTLGIGWNGPSYVPTSFARLLTDPGWERPYVILRTNTQFGVRTRRHLAYFDRWGSRGLFDLTEDPAAAIDRVDDQLSLFARLAAWMRATEAEVPAAAVVPDADVPAPDREALEALGYDTP